MWLINDILWEDTSLTGSENNNDNFLLLKLIEGGESLQTGRSYNNFQAPKQLLDTRKWCMKALVSIGIERSSQMGWRVSSCRK